MSLPRAEAGFAPAPGVPEAEVALPPAGSSFFLGLRILPPEQRRAMYAVYGFCRAVDDIADGEAAREDRLRALDRWRAGIGALYAGRAAPTLRPLAEAAGRYDLAREDFEAVIDGMAMDAEGDIHAPGRATLDLYVDCVAGAPGRLSVRVFGLEREAGLALAHHLGRALQLTNILRDVDEDAARGRLYLDRDSLEAAGVRVSGAATGAILDDPALTRACAVLAGEAEAHFREAERIMDRSPRAAVRAPRLMLAAYRPLLVRLVRRGWTAPRRPVRKSRRALALALLRHGVL